jgi:phosphoribosylformylglycinamidine synthase subunit PurL
VSDGGLLVAIAEMAMANGLGANITMNDASIPVLFGEDQGRYVITVSEKAAPSIIAEAKTANIAAAIIGTVVGTDLVLPKGERIAVARLRAAHEDWFPKFMGDGLA